MKILFMTTTGFWSFNQSTIAHGITGNVCELVFTIIETKSGLEESVIAFAAPVFALSPIAHFAPPAGPHSFQTL
jgi:hypothetical protein